jgi:hypothetical protein
MHEATELAKLAVQLARLDGKGVAPEKYLQDALDLIVEAHCVIKRFKDMISIEIDNDGDDEPEEVKE